MSYIFEWNFLNESHKTLQQHNLRIRGTSQQIICKKKLAKIELRKWILSDESSEFRMMLKKRFWPYHRVWLGKVFATLVIFTNGKLPTISVSSMPAFIPKGSSSGSCFGQSCIVPSCHASMLLHSLKNCPLLALNWVLLGKSLKTLRPQRDLGL